MKSNRKTLIIGSIGGVVAIAAILAAMYLLLWAPPTKEDFSEAKTTADKIATYRGSQLLGTFVTKVNEQSRSGLVQQELAAAANTEKTKVLDAVNARAKLADELSSSRIVRDAEVKKAFDTYAAKEIKYRTYMTGYVEAYPAYRSSFDTCMKVFDINDEAGENLTKYAGLHRAASGPCFEDLAIVEKSSITPLAQYAKEFRRIINERQKTFDGLEAKTLDTDKAGARIKELGTEYTKNNPTEGLKKFVDESLFNGELNALIKLLDDKVKATT